MNTSFLDGGRTVLQGVALMALAPAISGFLAWCAAWLQGRRRHPTTIFQPYRELARLYRQRTVRAETGSWLFAVAPVVMFCAYATLLFAVPVFSNAPLLRIDLIVVIYLLGLARFIFSLAGLDNGAQFGGLGGSREMFLHLHTEIAMILFVAGLALSPGVLDITALGVQQANFAHLWFANPNLILLAFAYAVIVIYETGRIPVDNPATHLELTMAHEAITGEYAGRDLVLIRWSHAIRLTFLLMLGLNLFPIPIPDLPAPLDFVVSNSVHAVQLAGLVALLALWEATRPKLRLRKLYSPLYVSGLLCLVSVLYVVANAK